MKKSLLITLLIVLLVLPCVYFYTNSSVTVNGQELTGMSKVLGSMWGSMFGITTLIFISFFMIFMFLGGGFIIMGLIFFMGIIFASFAFPFMLPLLIPLIIIWAIFNKRKKIK